MSSSIVPDPRDSEARRQALAALAVLDRAEQLASKPPRSLRLFKFIVLLLCMSASFLCGAQAVLHAGICK